MDLGRNQQARVRAGERHLRRLVPAASGGAPREDLGAETKRSIVVRALIPLAAELLGFAAPARAVELVDRRAITYDVDGYPVNLADLLEELLRNDPSLSKWYPS